MVGTSSKMIWRFLTYSFVFYFSYSKLFVRWRQSWMNWSIVKQDKSMKRIPYMHLPTSSCTQVPFCSLFLHQSIVLVSNCLIEIMRNYYVFYHCWIVFRFTIASNIIIISQSRNICILSGYDIYHGRISNFNESWNKRAGRVGKRGRKLVGVGKFKRGW